MKKRILAVDDNRLILNLLKVNLTSFGYEVITASDGLAGLKVALAELPDLILLDLMMPEMDGFEMTRQVRNNTRIAHIPIIMLTARGSTESIIAGLDAGADDYIAKPFDVSELMARVQAHLRRSRIERSLNPITNLPGNIAIEEKLKQLVKSEQPFAVVYVDIDNFKSFNDAYGFLKGDVVLRTLGLIAMQSIGMWGNSTDFLGHIGGDDFVIATTPDKVDGICQQIIALFDDQMPVLYSEEDREKGYVSGVTREGVPVRHPLMTVSLAVVANDRRVIDSHWQIAEIAAEVKSAAKKIHHSIYIRDLRTGRTPAEQANFPRQNEVAPEQSVALVTQDRVLRLVAPTILMRSNIKAIIFDTVAEALNNGVSTIIAEYALLTQDDQELLNLASKNGIAVIALQPSTLITQQIELKVHELLQRPYNLGEWVEIIKRIQGRLT